MLDGEVGERKEMEGRVGELGRRTEDGDND